MAEEDVVERRLIGEGAGRNVRRAGGGGVRRRGVGGRGRSVSNLLRGLGLNAGRLLGSLCGIWVFVSGSWRNFPMPELCLCLCVL